jgi:hypothetical protein
MTLYDALNFHQYQTISSVILSEAEEAIQRWEPANIDLIIANMNITPALRRKRGTQIELIIKTLFSHTALTFVRRGEDRVAWL